LYCRVKWLSTDVSEVRTASIIPDETSVDNHFTRQYNPEDSSENLSQVYTKACEIKSGFFTAFYNSNKTELLFLSFYHELFPEMFMLFLLYSAISCSLIISLHTGLSTTFNMIQLPPTHSLWENG
jgi:hypothetical protein